MKIKSVIILMILILSSCAKEEIKIEPFDIERAVKEIDPHTYKMGYLKKGETLAQALMNKDIETGLVYKLVNKLDKTFDLRYSHPNDNYSIKLDTLGVVQEIAYQPNKTHTYWVIRDTTNNFIAKVDTLQLKKKIVYAKGKLESSLWQAMSDQGIKPDIIVALTQIFQWDIDFFIDPQKGDEFQIAFETYFNLRGQPVKNGNILVASYESKKYKETAYRYTNKKNITKYYDVNGVCFQKAFLKSPLNYKRISSFFGSRYHPIRKRSIFHNGVDYAASYGTPVEASADGTVIHRAYKGGHPTENGRKGGYGKTVIIRHSNGYKTLYGHLSSYGKYRVGSRVEQHDVIGYVGSTGLSTGNHLHYTIYRHNKAINPLNLKNVSGPPVPKAEMQEFKNIVETLRKYLSENRSTI